MPRSPGTAAALIPALLAACSSFDGADARIAYLQTRSSGDVALGPSGGGSDLGDRQVDVRSDLGIGGPEHTALLGATAQTTFGRFGASAFWFDEDGSGTLSAAFGDIAAGTPVDAHFAFVNVKTYWVYDVVRSDSFRLAPGVALDFVDARTTVRPAGGGGAFEELDVFVPAPLLFLDGEIVFGPLSIAAQGGGSNIDLHDGRGTYWDFEGRVALTPAERVAVFAGYRVIAMDADGIAGSRDAAVDLRVDGWFLGGEVRF